MTTLDFDGTLKPAAFAPASPAFARVDVYADAAQIEEAWSELERIAPCSIYQTRRFILPWIETIGREAGIEPRFILARDLDRRPVALLCLGLLSHGPVRVAGWLGGKDANFNMPLLRRPASWTASELRRLLRDVARACEPARPDLFDLGNQPTSWAGVANPFLLLPHQTSPSAAFAADLCADPDRLLASLLSKDTRKKLRKKETKLAEHGSVSHRVAATAEERRLFVSTLIAQKVARLRQRDIASSFETREMRSFMELAGGAVAPAIELHALLVGDRIVAVYGGGEHGGRWSGMFNSFDTDETIARCSPADVLLTRIIAQCGARDISRLDLGIGEARYKSTFCKITLPMIDVRVPVTLRGQVLAIALACAARAKRGLKRNPRAMRLLARIRRLGSS